MQVEQKRACRACGSETPSDAGFCWRCLTPFSQRHPAPAVGPRPEAPRQGIPVPRRESDGRPSRPERSSKLLGAIVSIVAAFGGYFGVHYLMGPSLSLPDALAGAQRLSDAESERFERSTAEEGERYGVKAEAGVYGSGLEPEFFVILVDGAAIETTDQLFDALSMGFAQAGASVDGSGATSGERQGSDYRCIAAVAGPQTAVACMWRDADNVGIVLAAPGDLRSTRRLLWTVHDTVVG